MNDEVVNIDGSHGEGGGQIIRNAVTYACLLRRKLQVVNIRAGRPNPGLASQHLESILAMLRLTNATSQTDLKKGAMEFDLDATNVSQTSGTNNDNNGVYTTIDLKTAGSIMLCIQCVLPYLLTLRGPSQVKILGGTHVSHSPPFDYMQWVFTPIMNRFLSYNVDVKMERPGYYPRGGGIIKLYVNREDSRNRKFNHFHMVTRGSLLEVRAILNLTPRLSNRTNDFSQIISHDTRNIEVRTVSYASVEYFLTFENTYVGFHYLAEGRNPTAEDVFTAINSVQSDMKIFLNSEACVDSYMQDQLIMYMALAKLDNPNGFSQIRTGKLTNHTNSAIHVSKLFLGDKVQFTVTQENDGKTYSIQV